MKNILKWFTGFLIVIVLVTGLKMAKFSLLRPTNMDDQITNYEGNPHTLPRQNGPNLQGHPAFGEPVHADMEWSFVLADLIDLLVYALILLPLFYIAYLLGKHTLYLPKLNRTPPMMSSFKPDEQSPVERAPVSTNQSDYSLLDNHLLDQLL